MRILSKRQRTVTNKVGRTPAEVHEVSETIWFVEVVDNGVRQTLQFQADPTDQDILDAVVPARHLRHLDQRERIEELVEVAQAWMAVETLYQDLVANGGATAQELNRIDVIRGRLRARAVGVIA